MSTNLLKFLFSFDFKKQIEAAEIIKICCIEEKDSIKEISDLLIKWIFFRLWGNTNKSFLLSLLEMLIQIFKNLKIQK